MVKYSFKDDYSEGCHPSILEKLLKTTYEQQDGYGDDKYSREAKKLIKEQINNQNADIHFVSGGTQANLLTISSALRSHESVISAKTGHIHTHEAGAIEATGHKINEVLSKDGKLRTEDIEAVLAEHNTVPHMVKPKMVYISDSTEVGTVYRKNELEELFDFCKARGMYLFLDGARLGSALCAENNDLILPDLPLLTDVFYIGGTKNGALLGEAIVINNNRLKTDFSFHMKQRGALLSKGRVLGVQFLELLKNDLFFDLAKHANSMAKRIVKVLRENGYAFLTDSTSNQIFPILPDRIINKLKSKYEFYIWEKIDKENSVIRIVTSWATKEEIVDEFISDIVGDS